MMNPQTTSAAARPSVRFTHWDSLGILILLAGLALRAWLVAEYPAIPVSDFKRAVDFAADIAQQGPFVQVWHWSLTSAGTATFLSVFMALLPGDNETIARVSTMLTMALLPALPFAMLRGVLPDPARILATALIALHPALILFSGVVAQDNWVMLPTLALGCLVVRNCVRKGAGSPMWAAFLWGLSLFLRQEMLVVMLPAAIAAAVPMERSWFRSKALLVFIAGAALMIALVGGQRYLGTGKFGVTSEAGGASLLGSYIPGAGFGWIPFESYVASIDPGLADDTERMSREGARMAAGEIMRRPMFHLRKRIAALVYSATGGDGTLTYWSLLGDAQPPERSTGAGALANRLTPWLVGSMTLMQLLFLGVLMLAIRTRNTALLVLCLTIGLKIALHFAFPAQARFFLMVLALQAVAVGVAFPLVYGRIRRGVVVGIALLATLGFMTGPARMLSRWEAELAVTDPAVPTTRATLRSKYGTTRCKLTGGRMLDSSASSVTVVVNHPDPAPGEHATVICRLSPEKLPGHLRLEVNDPYEPGGFPDRMRQVVRVDGQVVYEHDIAKESGSGWWSLELPSGRDVDFSVSVEALRPDAGPGWGNAAVTRIRLVEPR